MWLSACRGCSKCMKEFPSGVFQNKLDHSGYDRDTWDLRSNSDYKIQSEQYLQAATKIAKNNVVTQFGVRYSVLLKLPYFDIIRMHVVDPMHNFLLEI